MLTGDMVDGSVADLGPHALPLRDLRTRYGAFMCLGNHDYYSGSDRWTQFWTHQTGIVVLRNEHVSVSIKPPLETPTSGREAALLMVAGVIDPDVRLEEGHAKPDPHEAVSRPYPTSPNPSPLTAYHLKLMLAHNPKLSAQVAAAGFNLQLSSHTHAGQFLPWT